MVQDGTFDKIFKDNLINFLNENYGDIESTEKIKDILNRIKNIKNKECDVKFKSRMLNILKLNNIFLNKEKTELENDIINNIGKLHKDNLLSADTFEYKDLDFDFKQFKTTIEYIKAIISGLEGDVINLTKELLKSLSELELSKTKIKMNTITFKTTIYYNNVEEKGNIEFILLRIIQDIKEIKSTFFIFNKQPVQIKFIYYKGEFDIEEISKKMNFTKDEIDNILNKLKN